MKFGLHHASWLDNPDPAEAFEAAKAKAQWAEDHGFAWFSVMDHTIQTPNVGAPDEYKQYGWEFPPKPATRIRQMEEAIQFIVKMWTEPRTTFHGRYFHVEDAILEPKPVQKPHPPVMIAGGGEQMTLRAVAQLADACNLVRCDVAEVRHKLTVLRGHCDAAGRDYDTIEKTYVQHWLLARDDAAVAAMRARMAVRESGGGFVGTVSEAIDLIGRYQDAGVELLIHSDRRNDVETRELFASDVMPHFA